MARSKKSDSNGKNDRKDQPKKAKLALPEVLRKAGPILSAAEAALAHGDAATKDLAQRFVWMLQKVRKDVRSQLGECNRTKSEVRRTCLNVLSQHHDEDAARIFLKWLLLDALDGTTTDAEASTGQWWYAEHRRLADSVLGNAIPTELRTWAAKLAYRRGLNQTAAADFDTFCDLLDHPESSGLGGVPTGLAPLDRMIGGLGQVTLVAGPTAAGKTSLAQRIAYGVVQSTQEYACLFIDLEQGRTALYQRWLALAAGVPVRKLLAGKLSGDREKAVSEARDRLKTAFVPFVRVTVLPPDSHREPPDADWFLAEIDRTLAATGRTRCLIVLDSIHRLPVAGPPVVGPDEESVVRQRLGDLDVARARTDLLLTVQRRTISSDCPTGFPILTVARCRKTDGRGRLDVDDVYGGVETVYDATTVILVEPDGEPHSPEVAPVTLRVAKHRNGIAGDIKLAFHHQVADFRERTTTATVQSNGKRKSSGKRFGGKS